MNSVEQSIAASMDCTDTELLQYLPYILQDFYEIGSSPVNIRDAVKKHKKNYSDLKVLDLGCGKGAVSIFLAKELKCFCHGIDAIKEFIEDAKEKAEENHIKSFCFFEHADIRDRIHSLNNFDVVILGSIGPVFGNFYNTLMQVSPCIKDDGIIIIDDGYIDDDNPFTHPLIEKKKDVFLQIEKSGLKLIDQIIEENSAEINEEYDIQYDDIVRRCNELTELHPHHAYLFKDYISKQKNEYSLLKNNVTCSMMIFKKRIS